MGKLGKHILYDDTFLDNAFRMIVYNQLLNLDTKCVLLEDNIDFFNMIKKCI